jgi:protein-S-isoprenylcysteine O-methyltransferase Ste14
MIALLRWFTFAAYFSILLVYFKGGTTLFKDIQESIRSTGSYLSTVLLMSMLVTSLLLLVGQLLVCLGHLTPYTWAENGQVVVLGTILATLSISVLYWFRFGYLGRSWSGSVKVQPSQKITKTGPYRIVRHPLYAMALVMYPGIALVFATTWTWLACGLLIIGYVLLAGYEDRFLTINLPGYAEYQQRTRYRLIPGVW